ncbi:fimbria/pilus periplasmic chaperone [Silvimonas sp.]|uniref:fimbria/pilus periplasmic chaperone n=1 Tax=Silvimonas sp. TaxID=2650811 RepID=UPI00284F7370|nr:fimbria/pilus periplasmic chaperone [Silvimonas sp.]MDR3429861.1 fimbria/pilus periplasmic chaperone [Silvimonas sp.]
MNIKKIVYSSLVTGLLLIGGLLPFAAQASVVIAGTRVIYNAQDSEVTIKLSNNGEKPALTQVWLDKGDPKADPSRIDLPFTITPPMSRIDPAKAQTLRIAYTGEPLPQDKESVFWLNMLEIPPKPMADEAGANHMQLAFRSRIKFFFRPAGLKGSVNDAPGKLTWHVADKGGKQVLQVTNPTLYHVTVIAAAVGAAKFDDGDMVAPGGTLDIPLKGHAAAAAGTKVQFTTLNDYGGPVQGEGVLQ